MKISSLSLALILNALFPLTSASQESSDGNKLYLLMASSEDLITHWNSDQLNPLESDTTKPSILFVLENKKLKTIDTINFNQRINTKMLECRHFEEFKFFYIRERDNHAKALKGSEWQLSFEDLNYVSVLDYSGDEIVVRKAIADSIANFCWLFKGGAYLQENQLAYTFSECENQLPYNRNLINKYLQIDEIMEKTFFNGGYERTESSYFYRNQMGYPFDKEGNLVRVFIRDSDVGRIAAFQFPYKVNSKIYSNIKFLLKSPLDEKEILFKELYSGASDSITTYYIYDKSLKQLDSISTAYKMFGMNLYQNKIGYGTLSLNPGYSKQPERDMPSPSRYSKKFGFVPNLQYNTGKFYIWNLHTNDFNIYAFDDLDTELLSIHEDWVYFRVFDELRRIALPDLESPEYQQKSELLYQDRDIVPNIHHVFWAPEMPVRAEWVKGR